MDRLRELANGKGVWKGVLYFLAFSAIVAFIGWLIGVFNHDPNEDGGPRMTYQPPTGERRY